MLLFTGHKLGNKLNEANNLHITSLLLSNGYLWIGTSAGAIMVYRTPYRKTVPITTGKPYMALHGHTGGVRVLISTQTTGTLLGSRFDQFVSEEQRKFQEEWEPFDPEESQVQPDPTPPQEANFDSAVQLASGEVVGSEPLLGEDGDSSTFPPLPPPDFDNLTPTGTLRSTTPEAREGSVEENDRRSRSSTPKAKPEVTHNDKTETSPTEMSPTVEMSTDTATQATPLSQEGDSSTTLPHTLNSNAEQIYEGIAMPVRCSSRRSSQKSDGGSEGRGTSSRNATLEVQDMGTFRRFTTLEAAAKNRPSPVREERENVEPTPSPSQTPDQTPPPQYDGVAAEESTYLDHNRSPSPYEDPTPLHLTGPAPLPPMPSLFSTLESSSYSTHVSTEDAIYVLTGGRGLVSLQPERRSSLQCIRPQSGVSTADESCIIAYELKH